MLALHALAPSLLAAEPHLWGDTVRRCMPALRVMAVSGNKAFFQEGRGPDGKPWAPLKHPRPGKGGSGKPLQDRGLLKASISASVTETELKLSASRAGANTHQFGATIRPKNAKRLAIPLTPEAKRAGSPRKGFPRPLFVVGVNDQVAYLAEQKGKGKRQTMVFHYVLVREVKIPQRVFVGFSAETLDKMTTLLGTEYNKGVVAALEGQRQAHYAANPLIR